MAYAHFDLVQKAEADLKAEGKIQPRPPGQAVEEDKGLLTRRAAYYIHTQRDPRIGLLEKTTGNNSQGYSVDWHVRKSDGEGWDVATDVDAGNELREAKALDGDPHGPNPDNIPRWRKPTAELAQIDDSPAPEPEPPPVIDDGVQQILDAIAASEAALKAHTTAETDRVMQRLADYRQEVIDFAEIAGKVLVVLGFLRRP